MSGISGESAASGAGSAGTASNAKRAGKAGESKNAANSMRARKTGSKGRTSKPVPASELQESLLQKYRCIAGMDEVGRGCLAGPVAVGVVVIDRDSGMAPAGLADSKQLSPVARQKMVLPILEWVRASAVGYASPQEIDTRGIIYALQLAGNRALHLVGRQLVALGAEPVEHVLLDGKHNWLDPTGSVSTQVKADATSELVAAASILAKVERDAWMQRLPDPGYDWRQNKGYASPAHVRGLGELGVSSQHRSSWKLPGVTPEREQLGGSRVFFGEGEVKPGR